MHKVVPGQLQRIDKIVQAEVFMGDAAKLYELQKIDLAWVRVARRLKALMEELGESDDVREARAQVSTTESTLQDWRAKQLDAELESKTLAKKIAETESQLMSGTVRDHRELENLQTSLEALHRHRTQVDDSAVEAMMHADEAEQTLATQREELTAIESEWGAGQTELREEETKLKQQYILLKRKRESVAGNLGDKLLERYETMRKRKGGIAIAPVENGVCAACHVQVPTGVVNGLGSATSLVLCPSCGRYLYGG